MSTPTVQGTTVEERLFLARRRTRLSQAAFGQQIGMSGKSVFRYEHNADDLTFGDAKKWALAAGYPVSWLLLGIEDPSDTESVTRWYQPSFDEILYAA